MTAPTGEAVNYETTVAELQAEIALTRTWLEQVTAALKSLEDSKNHITDGQDAYRQVASAVPTMLEHLAAMHVDGTTLGLIAAIKEAMPASDVDAALAAIEEAEAFVRKLQANAQAALDALHAALQHIQSKYGAAHETVQSDLGGDATFLGGDGSGGGGASVPNVAVSGGNTASMSGGNYGSVHVGDTYRN